jgi:protein-disulfide isomerase
VKRTLALGLVLIAGASVFGCKPSTDDQAAFGNRVRAYLLAHPEVLQEAADRLQAKTDAAEAAALRKGEAELPSLRRAVERDPRDFVANPGGKITVTEFYDYRCPHCVDAAPAVLGLIRSNPDVRFVFKEMPIFGPTSEHAARAALELRADGGDYVALYGRLMRTQPLDDAAIDRIAANMGVKDGETRSPAETRQLADTAALFNKLGLDGTPAFIVGDTIIPGEDMDAVNAAVARLRTRPKAS